jgi:hypothetical protein
MGAGDQFNFVRGNTIPQIFNVSGTLDLYGSATKNVNIGYGNTSKTVITLDGGIFNVYGFLKVSGINNAGGAGQDYSGDRFNRIILTNGAAFRATSSYLDAMAVTGSNVAALVFDIRDANSTVTAKFGGSFVDMAAVSNGFGIYFQSTTLGNGRLVATNDVVTFTVKVAAAGNSPPVITEGATVAVAMSENGMPTPFNLTLHATDANGDTLTWSVITPATNGTATASGTGTSKVIGYTPVTNYVGSDSFVVQVSDGNGGTDTITVNVTINATGVNNAPVITEGATVAVTMSKNGTPTPFSLALNATDTDGDTLTWSVSTPATNGTATASGTGTSKVIGYTPVTNYVGVDSFVVQVSDGNGGTDTITVNVTIQSVNIAPTVSLTAPTNGASFPAPASIALTATASDSDGTIASVAFYNGAILLGTDTTAPYAYTWTGVTAGSYSLTAQATDNGGAVSTSAVAVITVTSGISIWTGGVNNNWNNTNNWLGGILPSVDANGSIIGATNTITIQNGANKPTVNVPTMPNSASTAAGVPLFVIEPGAELTLTGFTTSMDVPSTAFTQVDVGVGGKLTWNVGSTIMLARNGTISSRQTYNINGTFNLNTAVLQMGKYNNQLTLWNLNGGTVNVSNNVYGGDVSGMAGRSDYINGASRINLANGSTFTVGNTLSQMEGTNTLSDPTLVFDIQDDKSRVTAKFGGSFTNIASVTNGFGTYFISSTFGKVGLRAASNDGTNFTVTVISKRRSLVIIEK